MKRIVLTAVLISVLMSAYACSRGYGIEERCKRDAAIGLTEHFASRSDPDFVLTQNSEMGVLFAAYMLMEGCQKEREEYEEENTIDGRLLHSNGQ